MIGCRICLFWLTLLQREGLGMEVRTKQRWREDWMGNDERTMERRAGKALWGDEVGINWSAGDGWAREEEGGRKTEQGWRVDMVVG